jgi:hypothetical protein
MAISSASFVKTTLTYDRPSICLHVLLAGHCLSICPMLRSPPAAVALCVCLSYAMGASGSHGIVCLSYAMGALRQPWRWREMVWPHCVMPALFAPIDTSGHWKNSWQNQNRWRNGTRQVHRGFDGGACAGRTPPDAAAGDARVSRDHAAVASGGVGL